MDATDEFDLLHGDHELERNVRLYLVHAGHRPVRTLEVEAHDGVVTLRGRVPSFYARQLAIACARRVAGVRTVVDQINADSLSVTAPKR
jgi:osmotically-inducible protein OsmY